MKILCKGYSCQQSYAEGYVEITIGETHSSVVMKMFLWLNDKVGFRWILDQFDTETILEFLEERKKGKVA